MADMPNLNAAPSATTEDNIAELKADLAAVKADLAQLIETLGRTARHGMDGASTEAEAAIGEVTEWAEGQYESVKDYIQAKPLQSVAIAAGIGAILGQILLRR